MTKDNRAIAQSFIDAIPHSHALGMKIDFVGDGEAICPWITMNGSSVIPQRVSFMGVRFLHCWIPVGGPRLFRILITMGQRQRLICVWTTCAPHHRGSVFAPLRHATIAPARWPLFVPLPWMIAKINLWPRPQVRL